MFPHRISSVRLRRCPSTPHGEDPASPRTLPQATPARPLGLAVVVSLCLVGTLPSQSEVIGWGNLVYNSSYHAESFMGIGAGELSSFALRADGTAASWGTNSAFTTLGTGIPILSVPPAPAGMTYLSAAAGATFALLLRSDGNIVGTGHGGMSNTLPVAIPPLPTGVTYTQVAASNNHALALRSDGAAVAWGDNNLGQCNVPALPAGQTYTKIAVGRNHSLCLRSDGQVLAFGGNGSGQTNVPPVFPGFESYVDIGASADTSYARKSSLFASGLVQWGNNMGSLPVGTNFTQIVGGWNFGAALRNDGTIAVWPATFALMTPPPLPAGLTYTRIAASPYSTHLVALRSDGAVLAWGRNHAAQCNTPKLPIGVHPAATDANGGFLLGSDGQIRPFLTQGDTIYGTTNIPPLPPGVTYTKVQSGVIGSIAYGCALRSDGQIVAWGNNSALVQSIPPLPPGVAYSDVVVNVSQHFAMRSDGELVAWGHFAPAIPALPPGVTYSSVDGLGMIALRSDGQPVSLHGNHLLLGDSMLGPAPLGTTYVHVTGNLGGNWRPLLGTLSNGQIIGTLPHGSCGGPFFPAPALPPGLLYTKAWLMDNGAAFAQRNDGSLISWASCQIPVQPQLFIPELPAGMGFSTLERTGGTVSAVLIPMAAPTVSPIGSGCAGALGNPSLLNSNLPALGNPAFTMNLTDGAPGSSGYLFISAFEAVPSYSLANGCPIYLELSSLMDFYNAGYAPVPTPIDALGAGSFSVAIPGLPALAGVNLFFQGAVLDVTVASPAITTTNALKATLN